MDASRTRGAQSVVKAPMEVAAKLNRQIFRSHLAGQNLRIALQQYRKNPETQS
jgi:hypothetical protein